MPPFPSPCIETVRRVTPGYGGVAPPAPVVIALSPPALRAVLDVAVGLALWPRRLSEGTAAAAARLFAGLPFRRVAGGMADEAVRDILDGLKAPGLLSDVMRLVTMFSSLCGASAVRVRLEHVDDDACRCLHVDAVGLRLLCTYAGRGTEWQDAAGTIRRMPAGHVGVFKGTRWPDPGPRILHRSPAVSHLPPPQRGRLLLCIDQIGYF